VQAFWDVVEKHKLLSGLGTALILAVFGLLISTLASKRPSKPTPTVPLTTTVTRTVTVPAQSSNGQTASGNGRTAPNSPAGLGWLSEISNPSNSNFGEILNRPVTVGGKTYAHTVQLVHPNSECTSVSAPSTVSFPVPSDAMYLSGMFGWAGESSGDSVELIVYAESPTGKVLWSQPFSNSGLPLISKRFDNIAGVHEVIFELVGQQCDSGTFVLAEAQFTS
jgi:hypothetical protein